VRTFLVSILRVWPEVTELTVHADSEATAVEAARQLLCEGIDGWKQIGEAEETFELTEIVDA